MKIHKTAVVDAMPDVDEALFGCGCVDQDDIDVAVLSEAQRLAGPHRDHVHLVARALLKGGQQDLEQARVIGTGGRRQTQGSFCGISR